MINSLENSIKSQTISRYNAALANYFGTGVLLGENDVMEILQKAQNLSTEIEQNYTQQKGIGSKPTIVAGGETLKSYSIPVQLHISYCNPDEIIKKLEEKLVNQEVFSWFRGEEYVGEFVINKVAHNLIDRIDNVTIYAEITVDLLEYYDDTQEQQYQQQTKKTVELESTDITPAQQYKSPVDVATEQIENIYDKLTDKVINKAMRVADGTINSRIGGLY